MKNLFVLIKKLHALKDINTGYRLLLIEAIILLGYFRIAVLVFPFRRVRKIIEKSRKKVEKDSVGTGYELIWKVRWAVSLASKYTPWQSKCLVQAATVHRMLKKRNINSTIYLGVGIEKDRNILAHAWVKYGDVTVIGESEKGFFKEVAKLS
ncbi:lasso peptide biosynthesis B2 protein [Clostridium thermarum]|uniref:lasso peptide biosynthesis B2 protein n=1 Tax=Clostridium thermarum TaxID=1716543 RepID=UPI00112414B5|nr:lasso peptide biosynthesis B2 protein [Clostridium thermarum]